MADEQQAQAQAQDDKWSWRLSANMIIFHDKCLDGFGAAYAAWRALGDAPEYVAVGHPYTMLPNVKGKRVVVLDFCFKTDDTKRLISDADKFLVIDHHHTAVAELKEIPEEHKIFDMHKSGCVLAWEFFNGTGAGSRQQEAPPVLLHVQDRDLWKMQIQGTREVCAALDTHPKKFFHWLQIVEEKESLELLEVEGTAILRYRETLVDTIAEYATQTELCGYPCVSVNGPPGPITSDIGSRLLATHPEAKMSLVWYINPETFCVHASVRSRADFDCSEIATAFGGGGHKQACGFTIPLSDTDNFLFLLNAKADAKNFAPAQPV